MTFIKKKPHEHEWGVNLYNLNGRYWFRFCKGFVSVKEGKIMRDVPCDMIDRWTTIKHRTGEIPNVMNEREERLIQQKRERGEG